MAEDFSQAVIEADGRRSGRFADVAAEVLHAAETPRILDLGCGAGGHVLDLARRLPGARFVGVDISPGNIAQAVELLRGSRQADRTRFVAADYMQFADGPFDAIVTDNVLYLMPVSDEALIAKMANDLAPGGWLICDLPLDGVYNRLLIAARRCLRAVRGAWTDRLILAAARLLHGGIMSRDQLAQRVLYMYLVPVRTMTKTFEANLKSAGFEAAGRHPAAWTSPFQLRHAIFVYRRRG